MPDFDITDLGAIVMFQPLNEAAEAWWHEYVNAEPWQYEPSGACSVDRHYAADILDALQVDGFSVKGRPRSRRRPLSAIQHTPTTLLAGISFHCNET